MSAARSVLLVARRELIQRVRSPIFVVSLLMLVVLVAAVIALPALFGNGARQVGLVDPPTPALEQIVTTEADRSGLTVEITQYPDVATAESALAAGAVDAVLVGNREVVWESEPVPQLDSALGAALYTVTLYERAAALGLEPADATGLLAPPETTVRSLEAVDPDVAGRRALAMVTMVLMFVAIALYGAFVLIGVVEEKSSRVVEVLLARIAPRHLLAGKILGIGALGLAQVIAMVVAGALALQFSDAGGIALPTISPLLLIWLVLWFILGFALYSTAYGALGALASSSEDAQNATGPVTIVLMVGYFFVFITVTADGPAWLVQLATLLPLTAPMAVPMRAAAGELPAWEAVAALVLMCLTIYGMIRLAGRIYTGAVLRTGARVKLRDAWRARA